MTTPLPNNGIIPPSDFLSEPFIKVFQAVGSTHGGNALYPHFGGAWNAVSYRFVGMANAAERFSKSIKEYGDGPEPVLRCQQEDDLFHFFSAGYSIFESYFYGMYAIGSFVQPANFPLTSDRDQRQVSSHRTREAYREAALSPSLVAAFDALLSDAAYLELRDIRNVLLHRTAPGRNLFASVGRDANQPAGWLLKDIKLDAQMTVGRRADIARMLGSAMEAAADFLNPTEASPQNQTSGP